MKRSELLEFMRRTKHVVQASTSQIGPQAAVVGIVVTDAFDLFFDTLGTARKAQNLRKDARIAFVIGGGAAGEEQTVQYEGIVHEPREAELQRLKQLYFAQFPDGKVRQSWEGITYFLAKPTWVRFSDYTLNPPSIQEFTAADLSNLG